MTFATPRQAVKAARDAIQTDLVNAKAYLQKAIDEKQNVQQKVNQLQNQIDVFDAWLAANL